MTNEQFLAVLDGAEVERFSVKVYIEADGVTYFHVHDDRHAVEVPMSLEKAVAAFAALKRQVEESEREIYVQGYKQVESEKNRRVYGKEPYGF